MEDDYDFDDNEGGVRVLGIAYVGEKYVRDVVKRVVIGVSLYN